MSSFCGLMTRKTSRLSHFSLQCSFKMPAGAEREKKNPFSLNWTQRTHMPQPYLPLFALILRLVSLLQESIAELADSMIDGGD